MRFCIHSINTNRTLNFDSEKIHWDNEGLQEYINVFKKTALSNGQEYFVNERFLACGWIMKNAYVIQILNMQGELLLETVGLLSTERLEEIMMQFFGKMAIQDGKNIIPKCKAPVVFDYITPAGSVFFEPNKTIEYFSKPMAAIGFEVLSERNA